MRKTSSYAAREPSVNGSGDITGGLGFFEAVILHGRRILGVVDDFGEGRWLVFPALIGLVLGSVLAWAHARGGRAALRS